MLELLLLNGLNLSKDLLSDNFCFPSLPKFLKSWLELKDSFNKGTLYFLANNP